MVCFVWEVLWILGCKDYPWLIEEKMKIKQFVVNLEKPYLDFC